MAGRRRGCTRALAQGQFLADSFLSQVHTPRPQGASYISPDDASSRPAMLQPCLTQQHAATFAVGGGECHGVCTPTSAVSTVEDVGGSRWNVFIAVSSHRKMMIIPPPFHTRRRQSHEAPHTKASPAEDHELRPFLQPRVHASCRAAPGNPKHC